MKKLLKAYGIKEELHYWERIVTFLLKEDKKVGIRMFIDMPPKNRKNMVKHIFSTWQSGLTESQKIMLIDYI